MIRKFKRWFRNWLEDDEPHDTERPMAHRRKAARNNSVGLQIGPSTDPEIGANPIRLFIYPANGGFVVETRTYDEKNDRNNSNLYLITDHEAMGDELSKIITMASLSR